MGDGGRSSCRSVAVSIDHALTECPCAAVAFRNLARNSLYAGITILGVAAGFAAAIPFGLYVRDEYSFERFIAGYEQVYRLETDVLARAKSPGR
jgi:hypothetical protein